MILRNAERFYIIWGIILTTLTALKSAEEVGPSYDTSEWIPIAPKNFKREDTNLEETVSADRRNSGRVLNLKGPNGVSFPKEEYIKTPPLGQYLREVSPVTKPRQKVIIPDQPYKFEDVLVPTKQNPIPQSVLTESVPLPPPNYYQNQPSENLKLEQLPPPRVINNYQPEYAIPINNSFYQSLNPNIINLELVDEQGRLQENFPLNSKIGDDKNVQLLYVPLEQLQQQRDSLQKEVNEQRQQIQLQDKFMQNIYKSQNKRPLPEKRPQRPEYYSILQPQTQVTEQSYAVQQITDYAKLNQYQSNQVINNQKSRLESIKQDFIQQALEAQKLQQQIQQDESSFYQSTTLKPKSKKRKPHQPPLAIYMGGKNHKLNIEGVLESLSGAKTIDVQDTIESSSPQVFVGPSNLNTPSGYARFPLPYLSNVDTSKIQRKSEELPFFVAPLNYKTPEGYYKIPLPSPHVGSVVISQKSRPTERSPVFQDLNQKEIVFTGQVNSLLDQSSYLSENSNSDTKLVTQRTAVNDYHPSQLPLRQYQEQNLYQQISRFTQPESSTSRLSKFEPVPTYESGIPSQTFQNNLRNQYPQSTSRVPTQENYSSRSNILRKPTTEREFYQSSVSEPPKVRGPSAYPSLFQDFQQQYYNSPVNTEDTQTDRIASIQQNNYKLENQLSTFLSTTPANVQPLYQVSYTKPSVTDNEENSANDKPNISTPNRGAENSIKTIQNEENIEDPSSISVNGNLPGLVNNLQDHGVRTLYSPNLLVPTTQKLAGVKYEEESKYLTEKYEEISPLYLQTTSSTTTTTTTKKSRGRHRGGNRFSSQSTTVSPSRKTVGRRRPLNSRTTEPSTRTDTASNNDEVKRVTNSRFRTRTRPPTSTERVKETVNIQNTQKLQEISTEPVSYMQYETVVNNERIVQTIGNPPNESDEVIKLSRPYYSTIDNKKFEVTNQEEPIRVTNVIVNHAAENRESYTEPSTKRNAFVYSYTTEEPVTETQRPKIRVRGRTRAKTRPSETTTPQLRKDEESNEYYGFVRQPNFAPSQQSEQNLLIYPPVQQTRTPFRIEEPETTENAPSSVRFVGEIRPKFTATTQEVSTETPKITTSKLRRTRVRVPGRNYQNNKKDETTSERSKTSSRTRGKTHFNPPRSIREKQEDNLEGQNYPAEFLKSRETTSSAFQITVKPSQEDDQLPYPSNNKPSIIATGSNEWVEASDYQSFEIKSSEATSSEINQSMELMKNTATDSSIGANTVSILPQKSKNRRKGVWRVVKHKIADNIETAESQDFRSHLNLVEASDKMEQNRLVFPTDPNQDIKTTTELSVDNSTKNEGNIFGSIYNILGMTDDQSKETITEQNELVSTIQVPTSTTEEVLTTFTTDFARKVDIYPNTEPSDFTAKTSISTEITRQTEMCYKGHCVKESV